MGVVLEKMALRKGKMTKMVNHGSGRVRLEFQVPTRGPDRRAHGAHDRHARHRGDEQPARGLGRVAGRDPAPQDRRAGRRPRRRHDGLRALAHGGPRRALRRARASPSTRACWWARTRAPTDMDVNVTKQKKLTNMRASTADEAIRLTPHRQLNLEQALEFIDDDELVEVTPSAIRLRKRVLAANMRPKRNEEELAGRWLRFASRRLSVDRLTPSRPAAAARSPSGLAQGECDRLLLGPLARRARGRRRAAPRGRARRRAPVLRAVPRLERRCAGSIAVPSHRIAARSRQFCSSRTLPGQEWSSERALGRVGELQALLAHLARVALQEGVGQERHVAAPSPQRRDLDRQHGEAEEEVLAESSCSTEPAQVAVGGRHHPHVDAERLRRPPTRSNCFSCTSRRILPWSGSGMSPISSRKSVPRWASSALPDLAARRPGEGALLVPEELVLEQVVRDGRAVDRDERRPWPAPTAGAVRGSSAPCRCRSRRAAARWRRSRRRAGARASSP